MAQHDYVIANGTGAAVRSDLNNALAAIVSQNSGATEPATTYAFQFWADTTTGLLKLRNSSNNAWVTLFQLDGEWSTLPVENGTAAAPSIYFKDSGTDTGFYSPGTDQVAISTAGTGRLFINSSGLVGIGTSSPGVKTHIYDASNVGLKVESGGANYTEFNLTNTSASYTIGIRPDVSNALVIRDANATANRVAIDTSGRVGIGTSPSDKLHIDGGNIRITGSNPQYIQAVGINLNFNTDSQNIIFSRSATEMARFDSSSRLLVGTSTAVGNARIQLQGNASDETALLDLRLANNNPNSGTTIGSIRFSDTNAGNGQYASIACAADAGTGSADFPGRLVFSVTKDGQASPTERLRVISDGGFLAYSENQDAIRLGSSSGAGTTNSFLQAFYSATGIGASNTMTGTVSIRIWSNGNVQNTNNSYTAISDIKLKENIVDAHSQWADIKALQVRNYNFKEGQTHKQIGLIAQEVEPISPGLVYESPDRDEDGNDLGTVTKSVNYSVLYMKAVKALQEAMERIEQLEAEMAEVKAQLS